MCELLKISDPKARRVITRGRVDLKHECDLNLDLCDLFIPWIEWGVIELKRPHLVTEVGLM